MAALSTPALFIFTHTAPLWPLWELEVRCLMSHLLWLVSA